MWAGKGPDGAGPVKRSIAAFGDSLDDMKLSSWERDRIMEFVIEQYRVIEKLEARLDSGANTDSVAELLFAASAVEHAGMSTTANCIRKATRQLRDERAVAEGWKLVPVEPTQAQLEAFAAQFFSEDWREAERPVMRESRDAYAIFLAAAPSWKD
jgi:hypothetical protein